MSVPPSSVYHPFPSRQIPIDLPTVTLTGSAASAIVPFRALLLLHGCSFYTQHYKKNDPHDPRGRASCAGFKKVNSCSAYKRNRHPHHSLSVNAAHSIFIELLPFIFGAHIISGQEVTCSAFGITEVSSHKKHQ